MSFRLLTDQINQLDGTRHSDLDTGVAVFLTLPNWNFLATAKKTPSDMLLVLPLAAALLLPAPLSKPSSPHLSSRRSVLGGAAAASALALLPTSPAFAASSGVFKPAAGSLEGTTIFITGANTGLGLESAKRLAAAGGSVVVSARSKAKAEEAAKEVGGKTIGIELDLADLSSVKSLPARLEAALGGPPTIDVLLNNAGVMAVPCRAST